MRGANGIRTTGGGRWRRPARMLLVAVGLLILGQLVPANASAAPASGLRYVGLLPSPLAGPKSVGQDCNIAQIDPAGRRLYVLCTNFGFPKAYLTEYDISKRIPVPIRSVPALPSADIPGSISPYDTAFDGSRHRLLLLATNNTGASVVHVIDLASLKQTGSWDLSRVAPGFAALGMTYAPRDGRVYLVGDLSGSPALASGVLGSKVIGPATSVVALDARTGKLAWIRPVPQCQQVLLTLGTGALIARSSFRPALYFFCSTGGSLPPLSPYPGEAGVVRLTITRTTSENKALHFPVVFFPISGSYTNGNQTGIAAFDPGSDRLFAQSLADSNPGAWVFDGRMSAWVGFIAAPHSDDFYLGIDCASGHYYMGGDASTSKAWVLVSDSRVTPVPQ